MRRQLFLLFVVASCAAILVPASLAAKGSSVPGLKAICQSGGGSFSIGTAPGGEYDCTTTNVSNFVGWTALCETQPGQGTWVPSLTSYGYICINNTGG
jgi:hypothetical protein